PACTARRKLRSGNAPLHPDCTVTMLPFSRTNPDTSTALARPCSERSAPLTLFIGRQEYDAATRKPTTLLRKWLRAAGISTRSAQQSSACTMGQRTKAGGSRTTDPRAVAATSKGLRAPQALGSPREEERAVTKAVWRTSPDARQARSSSARQGSSLTTKLGPVLHAQSWSSAGRIKPTRDRSMVRQRADGGLKARLG